MNDNLKAQVLVEIEIKNIREQERYQKEFNAKQKELNLNLQQRLQQLIQQLQESEMQFRAERLVNEKKN